MRYAPTLLRRFLVGLRGLVSVSPLILSLVSTAFVWIASRGALLSAPLIYPVVVVVVWMLANYFFEVVDHLLGAPDVPGPARIARVVGTRDRRHVREAIGGILLPRLELRPVAELVRERAPVEQHRLARPALRHRLANHRDEWRD